MAHVVLGLDIGGANLKAATADKRAVSVPFALWKQPDRLPAALADLVAQFPDATELAVTMTGELCDCYETKRQGVNAILDAVESVAEGRSVRVWSMDDRLRSIASARNLYLEVASANWHVLATFVERLISQPFLLLDIGSTTTDIIPSWLAQSGVRTDMDRLRDSELLYTGVRRTPVCAVLGSEVAAELFATTLDAYLLTEWLPEDPSDVETADGRPATIRFAHARLSRMLCGDPELMSILETRKLAESVVDRQVKQIASAIEVAWNQLEKLVSEPIAPPDTFVTSGAGEFLFGLLVQRGYLKPTCSVSLNELLGPSVSACAPAYAVAILADSGR